MVKVPVHSPGRMAAVVMVLMAVKFAGHRESHDRDFISRPLALSCTLATRAFPFG